MNAGPSRRIRVVTIGGGTGSSILLRGLKRYADRIEITAIVTTFDDGGSSGRLRDEFGVPALGDIRRCIAALLPEEKWSSLPEWILEHRFTSEGPLNNHSLGNLILLGIWQRTGSLIRAIEDVSESLGLMGRVVPVSEKPSHLSAKLNDGTIINGETNIDNQTNTPSAIARIYLDPPIPANPAALDAIRSAETIILGPGDLFTSVVPNLLPKGIAQAIQSSQAKIIQICNISPRNGQANTLRASDFPKVIHQHISPTNRKVHTIIVNTPSQSGNTNQIEIDEALKDTVKQVLIEDVADPENPTRHHPHKLADALVSCLGATAIDD